MLLFVIETMGGAKTPPPFPRCVSRCANETNKQKFPPMVMVKGGIAMAKETAALKKHKAKIGKLTKKLQFLGDFIFFAKCLGHVQLNPRR